MSDIYNKILETAEKHLRIGGFNGFSFRDIAEDVGLKSASIHYHFPTKGNLAVQAVRSYTRKFSDELDKELSQQANTIEVWIRVFRKKITPEMNICPCIVLGAGSQDLPEELANEVRIFFKMHRDKLQAAGLPENLATRLLASIAGAQLLAAINDDLSVYDTAMDSFMRQ